jgi:hypothetical protein
MNYVTEVFMLRKFAKRMGNILRFLENYRYYRQMGIHSRDAWHLAAVTLPD